MCKLVYCVEIAGASQEERGQEDRAISEGDRKLRLSLNNCRPSRTLNICSVVGQTLNHPATDNVTRCQ